MNVSAGIGLIGMASPMLQEVLGGSLMGVAKKFGELAEEKRLAHERQSESAAGAVSVSTQATPAAWVVLAWLAVGIPLAWGVYRTLLTSGKLFN